MSRDRQSEMITTLKYLCDETRRIENSRTQLLERLSQFMQSSQQMEQAAHTKETLETLRKDLLRLHSTVENIRKEQPILRSLTYPMMTARHSKRVDAHSRTFEWVFKPSALPLTDPRSSIMFLDWLQRRDGVYWITGKPGSGKSTFMKFVNNHALTKQALRKWSGDLPLVTASFYFWNSGTDLQKSQEGLLRSLLYEIMTKCPELISVICDSQWNLNSNISRQRPWQLSELSQAFQKLKEQISVPIKFCFFIDGLDEYEGDKPEMINVLKNMAASPNIKLCLASRPWNIYEDAFGQDLDRKLSLQDLTREDIAVFTRSKLLHRNDGSQNFKNLILEIVKRAQGVFLWVFLVVRSIQEGLDNGDTISILDRRLRMLPTELEPFFEHIINSVDPVYQGHMSCAFQVALSAKNPLLLLTYSFLDEEDPDFALQLVVKELEQDEIRVRQKEMNRRLNGRFKGLLETTPIRDETEYFRYRVDFLHRTVRDFLYTDSMQQMLQSRAKHSPNIGTSACRALLAQIKTLPWTHEFVLDKQEEIKNTLNGIMQFALQAESETETPDVAFMAEFGRTMQKRKLFRALRTESEPQHPCTAFPNEVELAMRVQEEAYCFDHRETSSEFLDLMFRGGLTRYTHYQLNLESGLNDNRATHWLMYALRQPLTGDEYRPVDLAQMVRMLYQYGTQQSQGLRNLGVWRGFLTLYGNNIAERSSRWHANDWTEKLRLLLRLGADVNEVWRGESSWYAEFLFQAQHTFCVASEYHWKVSLEILRVLFAHGLNPNQVIISTSRTTIWSLFLLIVPSERSFVPLFLRGYELFLQWGADPYCIFSNQSKAATVPGTTIRKPVTSFPELIEIYCVNGLNSSLLNAFKHERRHMQMRDQSICQNRTISNTPSRVH